MLDTSVSGRAEAYCEVAALVFLWCGGRAAVFEDAMLSVQWPVAFLGRPVIGRNGEEAGNGDHIEQEV